MTYNREAVGARADAELLALGDRIKAIRSEYLRRRESRNDAWVDEIAAESQAIVLRAAEIRPTTPAGWLAKARMAEWESVSLDANLEYESTDYTLDKILWSMVRDLLANRGQLAGA